MYLVSLGFHSFDVLALTTKVYLFFIIIGFKKSELRVLPSHMTVKSLWERYKESAEEGGYRVLKISSFRSIWKSLKPNLIVSRPSSDLCWVCQKNNISYFQ